MTADELLEAIRRAEEAYNQQARRVLAVAAAALHTQGARALPPQVALAVYDALDARDGLIAALDAYCRDGELP